MTVNEFLKRWTMHYVHPDLFYIPWRDYKKGTVTLRLTLTGSPIQEVDGCYCSFYIYSVTESKYMELAVYGDRNIGRYMDTSGHQSGDVIVVYPFMSDKTGDVDIVLPYGDYQYIEYECIYGHIKKTPVSFTVNSETSIVTISHQAKYLHGSVGDEMSATRETSVVSRARNGNTFGGTTLMDTSSDSSTCVYAAQYSIYEFMSENPVHSVESHFCKSALENHTEWLVSLSYVVQDGRNQRFGYFWRELEVTANPSKYGYISQNGDDVFYQGNGNTIFTESCVDWLYYAVSIQCDLNYPECHVYVNNYDYGTTSWYQLEHEAVMGSTDITKDETSGMWVNPSGNLSNYHFPTAISSSWIDNPTTVTTPTGWVKSGTIPYTSRNDETWIKSRQITQGTTGYTWSDTIDSTGEITRRTTTYRPGTGAGYAQYYDIVAEVEKAGDNYTLQASPSLNHSTSDEPTQGTITETIRKMTDTSYGWYTWVGFAQQAPAYVWGYLTSAEYGHQFIYRDGTSTRVAYLTDDNYVNKLYIRARSYQTDFNICPDQATFDEHPTNTRKGEFHRYYFFSTSKKDYLTYTVE